jgi:hypothetical protein
MFCNGKTGTTSIESVLGNLDEGIDFNMGATSLWAKKHMPPAVVRAMLPETIWSEYFKFVFVRDPLDWCVSQYGHNFKPPRPIKLGAVLRRPWRLRYNLQLRREAQLLSDKTILDSNNVDFLYGYLRQYRALPLQGSLFQKSYVDDQDGKQQVDFIGRFETLQVDLDYISERIGYKIKIPHLNATKRRRTNEALTPSARRRISELWAVDFERFDYRTPEQRD